MERENKPEAGAQLQADAQAPAGVTQLAELIALVRSFCDERDWDQFHDAKELAIGMVTEASELLDLFRFRSKSEVEEMMLDPARRERIEDEAADVLFFLLRLSGRYDVDLEKVLRAKIEKNAQKYPVEKSRGSNRKYNE